MLEETATSNFISVLGPLDAWLVQEQRAAAGQATGADGSQAAGQGDSQGEAAAPALPTPERPLFPPASLGLSPAFQGGLEGDEVGPDILMVAAFCHSFAEVLGLRPPPNAEQIAQVRRGWAQWE
jgi:hypothetical protein